MLKEKFEVREHVVKENILVEQRRFCDVCNKEIEHLQYYWTGSISVYGYDGYDSDDFDACSEECLQEKFNQYCEKSKVYNNYELDVERRMFKRKI